MVRFLLLAAIALLVYLAVALPDPASARPRTSTGVCIAGAIASGGTTTTLPTICTDSRLET